MRTKVKLLKKMTAVFISVLMALNILGTGLPVLASEPIDIAGWTCIAQPTLAIIPATSGELASGAVLTNFKNTIPGYSTGSYSITDWTGTGDKYWQISLSTKGYENLTLSAKTRSSGTGPRNFKVIYSVNSGNEWIDVPNGTYAITSTTLSNFMPTLSLPLDAANVDNLLIRFILKDSVSVNNSTIASGGTSQINNILVTGTPISNASTVGGITAEPENGALVTLGSKVALTCETEGASIMYSINNSEFATYDPTQQITLTSLPVTIKAYGTKSGMTNSVTSTFNYTQAQASGVTANPNGGAVLLNKLVTLSSTTPNAVIKYSLDNGATWNNYISPIKLASLPATIKTYATAEGMLDSATSTFNYTLKENVDYNIYFGQLHSHTSLSDGIGTLDDAYGHAKNTAKLDFFAVTDHSNSLDNANTATMADGSMSPEWVAGHDAADRYTDDNFVGIYGFEMTWSDGTGHMNTFNTPGFESRNKAAFTNTDNLIRNGLINYYNVLKQYTDSISQFNHPGSTFGDFDDFNYYDPQIDNQTTLIEVGNGEGTIGSTGYFKSYDFYTRALDKGWHLSPTNNQDNHLGKWGDANTARTVILADSLTRENVYDAMRNMRTYATEDNNLKIKYTLNGEILGSILSQKPDTVNIKVELEDPDNEALGTISVITSGDKTVTSKTITTSKDTVEFTLNPDYAYYYIRVDEADKDIAVTAPVWIGEVDKAGISKTKASAMPVKGEKLSIKTDMYNNEEESMNIKSLEYSMEGTSIHKAPSLAAIASCKTGSYSFDYTPVKSGRYNLDVKLTAEINGVERIYKDVLSLNVADPAVVTKVVIDGSHSNDYVTGNYANNMGNLITLANAEKINVIVQRDKLTDEALKDAKLLILSPPAKKEVKDAVTGNVIYSPSQYTAEEIEVIKRFADNGGNLIVTGLADYADMRNNQTFHTAYQQNLILQAIGAGSRINDDEVVDYENNPNARTVLSGGSYGTPYRVPMNVYNTASAYLNNVVPEQNYSFYSGCSITMGSNATWLVKGTPTTYGFDSDNDGKGGTYVSSAASKIPADTGIGKGNVVALAAETLPGGGKLFVGGTVFYSDFEIKTQLDNSSQLQNSNYNIAMNILDSIKRVIPVTPIGQVRSANLGDAFSVEGIVTAGTASGNAFFDTAYIQDSTGGINLFPVSGIDLAVGQKVKATGIVDEYLGDKELRIIDISITDTSINPVTPTTMTTKDAMDSKNGGMLLKVQGTVTKVDVTNNVVQAIYVKDQSGVVARLFVDGYINYSDTNSPKLEDIAKVGNIISGIGLASTDPDGNRLRVRDRSEITLIKTAGQIADEAAASAVTAKINAITAKVALADKAAVEAARTAYDALTSAQKSLVTNLTKLTAAEAVIKQLSETIENNDSVKEKINYAIEHNLQAITVDITNNSTVDKDIFNAIKGKDVTITFIGNGVSWTFNGEDITSNTLSNIDLSLKPVSNELANKISAKLYEVTGEEITSIPFSFSYDGELPGAAVVKIYIAKNLTGKTINIYRYYSDKNTYELVQSNLKVDSDGYVTYSTNHCSDYFAVETSKTAKLPKTGTSIDIGMLLGFGALLAALGVLLIAADRRRKNKATL